MRLAGLWRAEQVDHSGAVDERELGQRQDAIAVQGRLEGEVEPWSVFTLVIRAVIEADRWRRWSRALCSWLSNCCSISRADGSPLSRRLSKSSRTSSDRANFGRTSDWICCNTVFEATTVAVMIASPLACRWRWARGRGLCPLVDLRRALGAVLAGHPRTDELTGDLRLPAGTTWWWPRAVAVGHLALALTLRAPDGRLPEHRSLPSTVSVAPRYSPGSRPSISISWPSHPATPELHQRSTHDRPSPHQPVSPRAAKGREGRGWVQEKDGDEWL